ncbi:MAG: hypothetical protein QM784_00010 [Polyangiaceae bacterium]
MTSSASSASAVNRISAGRAQAEENARDEGCFVEHDQPIRDDGAKTTTDPKTGEVVTRVGASIGDQLVGVTVTELLKRPEAFQGGLVLVEGKVTAMCGHRRAWFAVVEPAGGGAPLRVVTAPAFLVPKDAIGKTARAVGQVEIREISSAAAEHQAKDHGMPADRRIVMLKATGAEFR